MDCKKVAYDSKQEANARVIKIQKEEGDNKKPIRAYRCPHCDKFHLTSFTKRLQNKVIKRLEINKINALEKDADFLMKRKQRKQRE